MGEDSLELIAIEQPHYALGNRHDRVIGVSSGGEGIRVLRWYQTDPRFGDLRLLCQLLYLPVQIWGIFIW